MAVENMTGPEAGFKKALNGWREHSLRLWLKTNQAVKKNTARFAGGGFPGFFGKKRGSL